ncbi:MAG: hypothetical protein K2J00_08940 [Bacteroidaceae bacterium]|nr:hypothetical protein [Bacteroidaceae bacterium]
MNYKTIKIALLSFTILPLTHICAHEASFRTFLSEHEKVNCIDSVSFGKAFDFIEDVERYSDFLPPTDDRYNGNIYINWGWIRGSRIEGKNYIAVTLQRYYSDFLDGNHRWFMENEGTDYVIITYSREGKMLDCKTVGRSGAAYSLHISAPKHGLGCVVEQNIIDDCSQLLQYINPVHTVFAKEYVLKSDGKIKEREIVAPHKEVVDVMSSVKQFSFEQFLSNFRKWDKPYVDHTLFTPSSDQAELPFESCLSLIPDTLDYNCWPREIRWIPCRYIETKDVLHFFVIKDCPTPKVGYAPYTNFLALEFHKDGTFKCASNIYYCDDNSNVDVATANILITKALKRSFVKGASN